MTPRQKVRITLDHELVVLVLEATEAAALDADKVLDITERTLKVAQDAVRKARIDAATAASRAEYAKIVVDKATIELEAMSDAGG